MNWNDGLFLKGDMWRDSFFSINLLGLAEVPFEGILNETYNGTRTKQKKKLDRVVIQLAVWSVIFRRNY